MQQIAIKPQVSQVRHQKIGLDALDLNSSAIKVIKKRRTRVIVTISSWLLK
jgi:hypothetical protein